MKNTYFVKFILIIIFLQIFIFSCHHQENFITLKQVVQKNKIRLPLPSSYKNMSKCIVDIVYDGNQTFVISEFPNFKKFLVYNFDKRQLISEIDIPISNSFENIQFVNTDSIWFFFANGKYYNYDSCLYLVDIYGNVKNIYSFYHPNILSLKMYPWLPQKGFTMDPDSVLFLDNNSYCNKIIIDNKLFFTTIMSHFGKKREYVRLPIAGYYDIKKEQIVFNEELFYPFLNDSLYYPYKFPENMYSVDQLLDENKRFFIMFHYTPVIYEWDYQGNKIKNYRLGSKAIDTIYPYKNPIPKVPGGSAYYSGMLYAKHIDMYLRYAILNEDYDRQLLIIFADTNLKYLGEALYSMDYAIQGEYNNAFYNASIVDDSIEISFFNFEFDKIKLSTYKAKLDSIKQMKIAKDNQFFCKINGKNDGKNDNNKQSSTQDFLKYSKYKGINDSTYALVILSKLGCYKCNEYILKFISLNQHVLFAMHKKPFYLLLVEENEEIFKDNLSRFSLKKNQNIFFENIKNYSLLNQQQENNPRLILVKNNKIVSDTIYMSDKLENLVEALLDFYGYEAE